VRIYDAATLELKAVIWAEQSGGPSNPAYNLKWSPDGSRLATASGDLRLWRPDGSFDRKLEGRVYSRAKFAWSLDGQQIASGDGADPKQVRVVNLDGTPGLVFKGHEGDVKAVAWSPDGNQLVSSSSDKSVRIWNRDGTAGPVLKGHGSSVEDVDWSPDGHWIASAGQDAAHIWKAEGTAGPVIRIAWLGGVRWHPDSQRFVLMSGANTQYLGVYDLEGS
jgi:WD40 repeat protein